MAHNTIWDNMRKSQFVEQDPAITSLFGIPAQKAGSIASTATFIAALLVVPTVFLSASKSNGLHVAGVWLGHLIWTVFVIETLTFIRLEVGWGKKWLRKHWLQLLVIFLASPLTAIVLEHAIMPLVAVLFSVQNFVSVGYLANFLSGLKFVKILKLEEARQRVAKQFRRVRWLYRSTAISVSLCGLGILGSAASGGAPTPLHGLQLWIDLVKQALTLAPELFVVTIPVVVLIGGFAVVQTRWSTRAR